MKESRRISVRLASDTLDRLHQYCNDAGWDISRVVREALEKFWNAKPDAIVSTGAQKRLSPPENMIDFVPPYLSWGQGDLREERKRLFIELLACSSVCKKHFPRTKGMLEGYEALLQVGEFFGVE